MFKLNYKKPVILLLLLVMAFNSNAQCAMCRAVLENQDGQSLAEGINDGIVYLMAIPYILVGGLGYMIYRKFYKVNSNLEK